jgi:hypothetical protein
MPVMAVVIAVKLHVSCPRVFICDSAYNFYPVCITGLLWENRGSDVSGTTVGIAFNTRAWLIGRGSLFRQQ